MDRTGRNGPKRGRSFSVQKPLTVTDGGSDEPALNAGQKLLRSLTIQPPAHRAPIYAATTRLEQPVRYRPEKHLRFGKLMVDDWNDLELAYEEAAEHLQHLRANPVAGYDGAYHERVLRWNAERVCQLADAVRAAARLDAAPAAASASTGDAARMSGAMATLLDESGEYYDDYEDRSHDCYEQFAHACMLRNEDPDAVWSDSPTAAQVGQHATLSFHDSSLHAHAPAGRSSYSARRSVRARAAGQPPRRKDYDCDHAYRRDRACWFERYTGNALAGDLADQQRMYDATVRAWRAYSDGRRSLSASAWDGRLTARDRHHNSV